MVLKNIFAGILVFTLVLAPSAYAGKVELSTYYPAPYGEYTELNASKSFIPPRMATADRPTATSNPPLAQGMVIFNTTTSQLEVNKDGTDAGWISAAGGGAPNIYFAIGTTNTSIATVSYGDMADMAVSLPANFPGGPVYIHFNAPIRKQGWTYIRLMNGGTILSASPGMDLMPGPSDPGYGMLFGAPVSLSYVANLTAGAHTIKVQWQGNCTQDGAASPRVLTVIAGQ